MTNKDIARQLKQTASLIELTGGNPFRSRAYSNAARTIERLEPSVDTLIETGRLSSIKGIGKGLATDIAALLETGSFTLLDDLTASIPPGLHDVLRIKGLGAKKVRALWQKLGLTSIDELEQAAQTDQISALQGFGAKSQANILDQIKLIRSYIKRRRTADVHPIAESVCETLRQHEVVLEVSVVGELRRQMETVDKLEILVSTNEPDAVRSALSEHVGKMDIIQENVLQGNVLERFPLVVHLCNPDSFGTTCWHLTGSETHCSAFVGTYGDPGQYPTEEALFESVGLPTIPPALRENDGELEAAASGSLPNLIDLADLRGSLHNHSTYSDGTHTLKQMANRARSMGLSYFGICDHSRSLTVAHGLSVKDVEKQQAEIEALNAGFESEPSHRFKIFCGIESDILTDGSLDYPDEVLASFDFIVASVHSGFNMTEKQATDRVIRAVEHPCTRILGHPTGRLLLVRPGYPLDHERVIDACAANGVAIELNANPYRLDMDWRWIRKAVEKGILISINPDAHSMAQLELVKWGVSVAQKGWLTPDSCLNAKSLDAFQVWIDER